MQNAYMEYTEQYDNTNIRGDYNDYVDLIVNHLDKNQLLVDLGCGTCTKTLHLSKYVKHLTGIDISPRMLSKAHENAVNLNVTNLDLCLGDNLCLPFESSHFDIAIASMTNWSASEVHRVLKNNGLFIAQIISPNDKADIKRAFGKDELGWRGRYLNQTYEERMQYVTLSLIPFFEIRSIKKLMYKTTLTKKGFISLLQNTPTIRNFDLEKDTEIVESLCHDDSIVFQEERLVYIAQKRRLDI